MKKVRAILEFNDPQSGARTMRWERMADVEGSAFELLGRAFEAAMREEGAAIDQSLRAFLHGALLHKQDVLEALDGASE